VPLGPDGAPAHIFAARRAIPARLGPDTRTPMVIKIIWGILCCSVSLRGFGCVMPLPAPSTHLSQGRIAVAHVSDVTAESASEEAVVPLATQESQRPLELALSQPELVSHESREVTLAQLPGTPIELGSSRRDQRRRSSTLSAASSVARHYRPLDDDVEVAQDRLWGCESCVDGGGGLMAR
jgi:hypothetical protein